MSPRRKPKGNRQGNRKATTRHGEADNRIVPLDNPSVHRSVGIPGGLGRSLEAPSTATMTGRSEEAGGAVHERRETRWKVRNQGRTGHVFAWCAQSLTVGSTPTVLSWGHAWTGDPGAACVSRRDRLRVPSDCLGPGESWRACGRTIPSARARPRRAVVSACSGRVPFRGRGKTERGL